MHTYITVHITDRLVLVFTLINFTITFIDVDLKYCTPTLYAYKEWIR